MPDKKRPCFEEVCDDIANISKFWQVDSFADLVKAMRYLNATFNRALSCGPMATSTFFNHVRLLVLEEIREAETVLRQKHATELIDATITGIKVVDDFRMMLKKFDFYYSHSDDIEVWRRGDAQHKEILAAIKKDPILQDVWNHYLSSKN